MTCSRINYCSGEAMKPLCICLLFLLAGIGKAQTTTTAVDVPAIQEEKRGGFKYAICSPAGADNVVWFSDGSATTYFQGVPDKYQALRDCKESDRRGVYTCADKSRILLKSEDGKEHCLKF